MRERRERGAYYESVISAIIPEAGLSEEGLTYSNSVGISAASITSRD